MDTSASIAGLIRNTSDGEIIAVLTVTDARMTHGSVGIGTA
jgi:acylphosphatase